MTCQYCQTELPEKGFYCPNCFKQTKCKLCNEALLADTKICIYCGELTGQQSQSANTNTIEFSETKEEKKFKASFSDTVAQSVSQSFGAFLGNKINQQKSLGAAHFNPAQEGAAEAEDTIDAETEIIDDVATATSGTPKATVQQNHPSLTEIKMRDLAKTETDWILVYAHFSSDNGKKEFTRDQIREMYTTSERRTDNRIKSLSQIIKNLSKGLYIKPITDDKFILIEKGKQRINEIFSGQSVSKTVNTRQANPASSIKTEKPTKKSNAANNKDHEELKFLSELNLKPAGKDTLITFAAKYKIGSNDELFLLIVHYLQDVLKEKVSIPHIFTCMRELGKKTSPTLKQLLVNSKNKKHWINLANWNDIKVTVAGSNHMIHDFKKAVKS